MAHSIPNFDAMNPGELTHFWLQHYLGNRARAEKLIGDKRKGYVRICQSLANYAINKETAMRCRKNGDIPAAIVYEKICDGIYDRLPDDLKW